MSKTTSLQIEKEKTIAQEVRLFALRGLTQILRSKENTHNQALQKLNEIPTSNEMSIFDEKTFSHWTAQQFATLCFEAYQGVGVSEIDQNTVVYPCAIDAYPYVLFDTDEVRCKERQKRANDRNDIHPKTIINTEQRTLSDEEKHKEAIRNIAKRALSSLLFKEPLEQTLIIMIRDDICESWSSHEALLTDCYNKHNTRSHSSFENNQKTIYMYEIDWAPYILFDTDYHNLQARVTFAMPLAQQVEKIAPLTFYAPPTKSLSLDVCAASPASMTLGDHAPLLSLTSSDEGEIAPEDTHPSMRLAEKVQEMPGTVSVSSKEASYRIRPKIPTRSESLSALPDDSRLDDEAPGQPLAIADQPRHHRIIITPLVISLAHWMQSQPASTVVTSHTPLLMIEDKKPSTNANRSPSPPLENFSLWTEPDHSRTASPSNQSVENTSPLASEGNSATTVLYNTESQNELPEAGLFITVSPTTVTSPSPSLSANTPVESFLIRTTIYAPAPHIPPEEIDRDEESLTVFSATTRRTSSPSSLISSDTEEKDDELSQSFCSDVESNTIIVQETSMKRTDAAKKTEPQTDGLRAIQRPSSTTAISSSPPPLPRLPLRIVPAASPVVDIPDEDRRSLCSNHPSLSPTPSSVVSLRSRPVSPLNNSSFFQQSELDAAAPPPSPLDFQPTAERFDVLYNLFNPTRKEVIKAAFEATCVPSVTWDGTPELTTNTTQGYVITKKINAKTTATLERTTNEDGSMVTRTLRTTGMTLSLEEYCRKLAINSYQERIKAAKAKNILPDESIAISIAGEANADGSLSVTGQCVVDMYLLAGYKAVQCLGQIHRQSLNKHDNDVRSIDFQQQHSARCQ